MRLAKITLAALAVLLGPAIASAQTSATPPPAPPAGAPAIFKSAADLADALAKAKVNPGGMSSTNAVANDQYRASLIKRDKPAGALAHPGNTELLYIVDGAGTMTTGGTLVPGGSGKPATIRDGVSRKIARGDLIIVPPNTPHWFSAIDAPITYLEVRWVEPK